MIKIAPSILAADFSDLRGETANISTADYIHVDIMDGHFVPNFSMGFPIVEALHRISNVPLDVHLMIEHPVRYIERFANAGADLITVHLESDTPENIRLALHKIRNCGNRAGIVIKPCSDADSLLPYLDMVDLVLVMTVEPGLGGQSFMKQRMATVRKLRQMITERNLCCELEVDGGIKLENASLAVAAGADVLVSGTGIFDAENVPQRISDLRNAAQLIH